MSTISTQPRAPVEVEERVSFTPAQRMRVLATTNGTCDRCTVPLVGQPWHVDHVLARALGGKHHPSNWRPLCVPCHAVKTKQDNKRISKAKRIARRIAGEEPPKQNLGGRGFRRDPLSWRNA